MSSPRAALVVLLFVAAQGAAHGQSSPQEARARGHFEVGHGLFRLGNYEDAIKEFAAGYQLVPKPQFLVDMAQCYRKLGNLERARELYRKYLAEAPIDSPERSQVEGIVTQLDQ